MSSHQATVHENQKSFKCDVCGKFFGYKHSLKIHIDTVHQKVKAFECEICQKSFGQKVSLKKHLEIIHEKMKKFETLIAIALKDFSEIMKVSDLEILENLLIYKITRQIQPLTSSYNIS